MSIDHENLDPRIESLISKRLDHETLPDDDIQLDRALLRDPVARNAYDLSTQLDALANSALQTVAAGPDVDLQSVFAHKPTMTSSRWNWFAWSAPLAAAACLAIAFGYLRPTGNERVAVQVPPAPGHVASMLDDAAPLEHDRNRLTGRPTERVRRQVDRDLLGVIGDDGNVYWVQVDHERTVRKPADVRLARADY